MTMKTRMVTRNFTPEGSAACMIAVGLMGIIVGIDTTLQGNMFGIIIIIISVLLTILFTKMFKSIANNK